MGPNIVKTSDLQRAAVTEEQLKVNKMMTKSLDFRGRFRIQIRGSIFFVKMYFCFITSVIFIVICVANPGWFVDHFIHLYAPSKDFLPYLHLVTSIFGYYAWEVSANRYGKLAWSVLAHHWVTAMMACLILLGTYCPFATWYAVFGVGLTFPIFFTLGFRAQFSNKYPEFTRKAFVFSYYWYLVVCIIANLSGQVFLIVNSLLYHYNDSIPVYFIVVVCFCIGTWLYEDIQLLKALKACSIFNYEDAEIMMHRNMSLRMFGGKDLPSADLFGKNQQNSAAGNGSDQRNECERLNLI